MISPMEFSAATLGGRPGWGSSSRWSVEAVEIAAPLPLLTPEGTVAGGGVFLVKVKSPPRTAAAPWWAVSRAAASA